MACAWQIVLLEHKVTTFGLSDIARNQYHGGLFSRKRYDGEDTVWRGNRHALSIQEILPAYARHVRCYRVRSARNGALLALACSTSSFTAIWSVCMLWHHHYVLRVQQLTPTPIGIQPNFHVRRR